METEKGELEAQRETFDKRGKRKLERAYDGGGWLKMFTSFQDVTNLSREEFRDALR